jgi:predicted GIY-YIG superfamily endonuclease
MGQEESIIIKTIIIEVCSAIIVACVDDDYESDYIYVLQLECGKYYVGKTRDVARRFEDHQYGNGSVWTSKYRPICIEKEIKSTNRFDEDNYVKEYMMKHGIDNVRGGVYSTVILSREQRKLLEKEFLGASNLCFHCGDPNHYIQYCPDKFKTSNQEDSLTMNKGKRWTDLDDKALIDDFDEGICVKDLALAQSRSEGAIISRLNKLGKLVISDK